MVDKLIRLEQKLKIIFDDLESLDKSNKKDSPDYNKLLIILNYLLKKEEAILNNLRDFEIHELLNKILDIKKYIPLGITLVSYSSESSIKILTRLSNLIFSRLETDDYESRLNNYLTIDELMLALHNSQNGPFIELKYFLAFIIPQIGELLLQSDFSIPTDTYIISDTANIFYNIDDNDHQKNKDKILKERFKLSLRNLIYQYKKDVKEDIYFYLLREILKAIYILASDELQLELKTIYNKEIEGNEKLKKFLANIFEFDLENILKVTFA